MIRLKSRRDLLACEPVGCDGKLEIGVSENGKHGAVQISSRIDLGRAANRSTLLLDQPDALLSASGLIWPTTSGVSSDGAGGARRGPCCWLARRSPRRWRHGNTARDCERRDRQQDGPNARGRVAREEWAATSVRRVVVEATLWALDHRGRRVNVKGSSAHNVASGAARFAGRGSLLTLRRCEGERDAGNETWLTH